LQLLLFGKAISQIWDNFDIYPLMNISIYYYLLALISGVELKASNAITEGTRCKRATYIIIIDNLMYGIGQGNINDF